MVMTSNLGVFFTHPPATALLPRKLTCSKLSRINILFICDLYYNNIFVSSLWQNTFKYAYTVLCPKSRTSQGKNVPSIYMDFDTTSFELCKTLYSPNHVNEGLDFDKQQHFKFQTI